MTKIDKEAFTKIAGKLLLDVRELVDWGIDTGNTTPEKMRLTIMARRELSQKLIASGMTQRQAAKALGVGLGTVQRDIADPKKVKPDPKKVKAEQRAKHRAEREQALATAQLALPDKRYGVILADPEWQFETYSEEGQDRAAANHYATSMTEEIMARDVPGIAAPDCVLFLWATAPMLLHALDVMDAWGFEYKSHLIWDKQFAGTGYWFRNRHELLLVGTKGNIPAPAPGTQYGSIQLAPRGEHSAKPDMFHKMIEDYYPNMPKIELNCRGEARPGWDAWGVEATQSPQQAAE